MNMSEEKFPAQWALDLLEPRPEDYKSSIFNYDLTVCGMAAGLAACLIRNLYTRRPLYYRIHVTIPVTVLSGLGGYAISTIGLIKRAKSDAVMRDYIRQHPERFPEPENKKYADIFDSWTPVR